MYYRVAECAVVIQSPQPKNYPFHFASSPPAMNSKTPDVPLDLEARNCMRKVADTFADTDFLLGTRTKLSASHWVHICTSLDEFFSVVIPSSLRCATNSTFEDQSNYRRRGLARRL